MVLDDSISKLHLVNLTGEKALNRLGIKTVEDLLFYFPRDWQDLSEIKTIADIRPNEKISIRAKIKKITGHRSPRRRMYLLQAILEDETGNVVATWFNQPFLKNTLQAGREYYFHGKAQIYDTLQLQNPAFELVKEETIHTAGIIPAYELTEGITQKQVRYFLKQSLEALTDITDFLPRIIQTKLDLADLRTAIKNIHFPDTKEALEAARERLAFDELFLFQLALSSYKQKLREVPAPQIAFDKNLVKSFVESLPFKLTGSQRLAAWEILRDLERPHPMNRLLEGEVGSGKTVVAGIAMLQTVSCGFQSVLLAPTEILAWQHYQTLKDLFKRSNIEIALLTRSHNSSSPPLTLRGGTPSLKVREGRGELLKNIASREIKIIIGTHAILQEHVTFNKIGILVVDEQHRFGVKQRMALLQRGSANKWVPHLLSMTATPIPRTLALAFYGDLDISTLKELPKGRKKIITRLIDPKHRNSAYEFLRIQIQDGRQAYVVVPLIGDGSTSPPSPPQAWGGMKGGVEPRKEIKEATSEVEKLKQIFPEFQIGLMHGKLAGEEKKQIMADFKSGRIDILVSTTVIEVGMDIANASVMLIENAERFGLSQLHQLRGRVGRAEYQSYCLLFAEIMSRQTRERLEAVVKSTDGFELAEADLKLRGPGEVIGTKQSGYVPFKIAKLSDKKLIKQAQAEAKNLLAENPGLSGYPELKQKTDELAREAHLE